MYKRIYDLQNVYGPIFRGKAGVLSLFLEVFPSLGTD